MEHPFLPLVHREVLGTVSIGKPHLHQWMSTSKLTTECEYFPGTCSLRKACDPICGTTRHPRCWHLRWALFPHWGFLIDLPSSEYNRTYTVGYITRDEDPQHKRIRMEKGRSGHSDQTRPPVCLLPHQTQLWVPGWPCKAHKSQPVTQCHCQQQSSS